MGNETGKAYQRRLHAGYFDRFLIGHGIDIGCGTDKLKSPHEEHKLGMSHPLFECDGWDVGNGDAQLMHGVDNDTYDFVYSSHCLEHMKDPNIALKNWWRILKPGGHLFVSVPDENLYEQRVWPSRGNGDHKTTWRIGGDTWSPVSQNVLDIPAMLGDDAELVSAFLVDTYYDYERAKQGWFDQSGGYTEVSIEFIIKKKEANGASA